MSARIEVVSGPLAGKAFPVRGATFSIGREAGNDLVLEDGTVSRRHVLIVPDASGAAVRDLGSRNGILLDGKPAREGRLAHGESFSVGRIACRFLLDAPPPKSPEAPAASPAKGGGFDRRFALVLAVSGLLVAAILFLWYLKAHPKRPEEKVVSLLEGEERYQPFLKGIQDFSLKDPKGEGVVRILKRYKGALAFRAMAQGEAEIDVAHEGGARTLLKVSVHGHKSLPPWTDFSPEDLGNAAKLEEKFRRKMAEAVALASEGKLRDALVIAQATEGFYYAQMPKPPVAVEARDRAKDWGDRLQEKIDRLEEERIHQSDLRNYEAVRDTLWAMRDLVELNSAARQRLQFLMGLNEDSLSSSPRERR